MSAARESDDHERLRQRLSALRVGPGGDDAFRRRLHQRLADEGPPGAPGAVARVLDWLRGRPGLTWPAAGVLAGAATFLLLTASADVRSDGVVARDVPAAPLPPAQTFAVPTSKVAVINLNFSAEVSVEDVTFEVALPEGLSFWSRGERLAERTFRWPGRLAAGDNWLPIAVRGERPGRYRVKAKVEARGSVLEQDVVLEVKGA